MALTYTWAITSLKKTTDGSVDNFVVQSTWTCTGTDEDGDSGVFNGATPFPLDSLDPATFIPYEDLTEADVLGWIQAVVVGSYKDHVDAQINKQIALIKDPVVEVPNGDFPWDPTPTPTPPVSAAPEGEGIMNPELDKYDVEKQAAPEITVILSIQELNTVLAALAEMPHRVSDPVIRKVFTQANEQIPQQRVN